MTLDPYGRSLALLTDLYQLTMAYGYWKEGLADRRAAFHLFYRRAPFKGEYAVACGLDAALRLVTDFRYSPTDIDYLASLKGNDDTPLFDKPFLGYLSGMKLTCDVDALPEGTPVFPREPLARVTGPLLQCQLLETPLLTLFNFQTLIATKATRICRAAQGQPVLEFGLRRAQGIDGGLSASRSAYIGGCAATSNLLAGKQFGIPVRGTMAHSWVMAFDDELDAFDAYIRTLPNNCVLLVDTHTTRDGITNAIAAVTNWTGKKPSLAGIRIDSGDLASLAREARSMLDAAGLTTTAIVVSGDLDEHRIAAIKATGAPIDMWGVGTAMVTAADQPALDGVYKLGMIENSLGRWQPKIKVSDHPAKTTLPGQQQIRRYLKNGQYQRDVIYDLELNLSPESTGVDLTDPAARHRPDPAASAQDLLVPVIQNGRRVYESPPLEAIRQRVQAELARFPARILRLNEPERYPVEVEERLFETKNRLIKGLSQP